MKAIIIGAVALPLVFAACGGGGGVEGEAITVQTLARNATPENQAEVVETRVLYDEFRKEDGTIDFSGLLAAGGGQPSFDDYVSDENGLINDYNLGKFVSDGSDFYTYCAEILVEALSDQEFMELCYVSKDSLERNRLAETIITCGSYTYWFSGQQITELRNCQYGNGLLLELYEYRSGGLTREIFLIERASDIFAASFNDNSVSQIDSLVRKLERAIGSRGECEYRVETYRYDFHCNTRDFKWDEWRLQGEWGINYPFLVGDGSSCVRYCGAGPYFERS